VCDTKVGKARKYAEKEFEKEGKDLDDVLPDFDKNYRLLRKKCSESLDIDREDMPVVSADDIRGQLKKIQIKDLLPTQGEIWLEKVIKGIIKKGTDPFSSNTIVVSEEGYVLDGHHRYAQAMLAGPDLEIKAVCVPLDIKKLLQVGKAIEDKD